MTRSVALEKRLPCGSFFRLEGLEKNIDTVFITNYYEIADNWVTQF